MSEAGMRRKLVDSLRVLDAVPVENRVGPGTPDVNYSEGWIECKWLRHWPRKFETPVALDHPLLPEQRAWLQRRRKRNGAAWVMLQCRREWFLFDGAIAAQYLGYVTRDELCKLATKWWPDGLNEMELVEVLGGHKV
jgi:hypothetical protein